jgi:hypothetical protein
MLLNLGIGTTGPGEKLEVNGNIKLSGASATYKITNVVQPTAATDVATKAYVDAAAATKLTKRVFITSTIYKGNLGGLSEGDAKCQARADAVGLGGTWKAILSTSTVPAKSRIGYEVAEKVVAAGFSLRYIAQPKGCDYHICEAKTFFQQSLESVWTA